MRRGWTCGREWALEEPHLVCRVVKGNGALEPVLEPWWQRFPGPFLYYPGRRLVPAPLRAFIDFIKA